VDEGDDEVPAYPVLLRDGDRVVIEVERVGRLENPVVAERA
jgi:2-keto-4-pentenoate hydratase/2-oxohepta-3-ene-1,7-dioic acid hydratase in catechol pathway